MLRSIDFSRATASATRDALKIAQERAPPIPPTHCPSPAAQRSPRLHTYGNAAAAALAVNRSSNRPADAAKTSPRAPANAHATQRDLSRKRRPRIACMCGCARVLLHHPHLCSLGGAHAKLAGSQVHPHTITCITTSDQITRSTRRLHSLRGLDSHLRPSRPSDAAREGRGRRGDVIECCRDAWGEMIARCI